MSGTRQGTIPWLSNFDRVRRLLRMNDSAAILATIEARLSVLLDERDRLLKARSILTGRKPLGRPPGRKRRVTVRKATARKPLRKTVLPAVPRRGRPPASQMAAADDVLAALANSTAALGRTGIPLSKIAADLDAHRGSVAARLRDLGREGLVTRTPFGWVPARNLPNWVEHRARELAEAA